MKFIGLQFCLVRAAKTKMYGQKSMASSNEYIYIYIYSVININKSNYNRHK